MSSVLWSVRVRNVQTGAVLFDQDPDRVLRTASVGKILLLVHVAELVRDGRLDLAEPLTRTAQDAVADSGIWQYLSVDTLPVADLCELVGIASDNLASNVLIGRVGLGAVAATAARLGLRSTGLHDRVRDVRTAGDPETLSTGTAAELADLMWGLHRAAANGEQVGAKVLSWLAKGVDLSQVASGWNFDPLAHLADESALRVVNKTGTDAGVRAETGVLTGSAGSIAYAVLANWDAGAQPAQLDLVLGRQRRLGLAIAAVASGGQWPDS